MVIYESQILRLTLYIACNKIKVRLMEHEMTFLKMGSPDTYLLRLRYICKNFSKEVKSIFNGIWKASHFTTGRKIEIVHGTLSTNSQYQIKVHRYIQYIGSMYYFYSNNVSYDWRQSFNAAQFRSIICYAPLQHTVVENWENW